MADLLADSKELYCGYGSSGTSEQTLATVGAGKKWVVLHVSLCNTTSSSATISLSFVASGGSGGDSNRFVKAMSIEPASTEVFDVFKVMAAGGFISVAQGTSQAITILVDGVEVAV